MDPDVPYPSIEVQDDSPVVSHQAETTKTKRKSNTILERMSIGTATSTPLPPSSPLKSPRKTPRLHRQSSSLGSPSRSPSYRTAESSPLQNDGHSTTQTPNTKRPMSNRGGIRDNTPPMQNGMRRMSSNLNPLSPVGTIKPLVTEGEKKKAPMTAATVARDYFSKELALNDTNTEIPQTAIIVHDSCYGHRFSRPRTSRAALSTIVERPERILATLLGVSTAYIRLGGRHAEGKYEPHPQRDPASASPPPFAIRKTRRYVPLNHPAVTHVHGVKWMEELQIMCDSAEGKLAMNGKELVRPIGYGKDESGNLLPKLHEGDLYLCTESLNALQGCLGGVCDAVDTVFSPDITTRAFVCIRPPGHHCSSNFPSGFCWLNNVHVGIAHAAINHGLTHAAIIDFDLHHGDGSQTITWDHNRKAQTIKPNSASHKKTPIGYFSLHDINSYPCEMGDEDKVRNASLCIENAHGQSIWNVHLESWKTLGDFWKLYETRYMALLEKTRLFLRHHTARFNSSPNGPKAKAAIFLSAGFDASEWEGAGMQRHQVNVPTDFYARFTSDVVKLAEEEGLGADGRVISVLEGGYSDRALTSGVLSHVCGLAERHPGTKTDSLALGSINGFGAQMDKPLSTETYNTGWWNEQNLELLELRVNPMGLPKKHKEKFPGNYTTPTEASTAKMTDVAKERRSLSSQLDRMLLVDGEMPQPAPEVDWATAAYELSRLIIPADRQILSCTHEDLNAEATRARKERQSTIGLPVIEDERRQLRDRKSKAPAFEAAPVRSKSRDAKRRTTVASVSDLPDPDMKESDDVGQTTSRPRRRSSAASSMISTFEGMQLSGASQSADEAFKENRDSRGSSVAAVKAQKAPAVKKPRQVGNMKPPPKARSSPKKASSTAPPVPRVPSALYKDADGDSSMHEVTMDEQRLSQASSRTGGSVVKADDVDNLAGGMKKMSIKLKLPSPEEQAIREEKAAVASRQKPKAARKPAVPRATKVVKAKPVEGKAGTVEDVKNQPDVSGVKPHISLENEAGTSLQDVKGTENLGNQPQLQPAVSTMRGLESYPGPTITCNEQIEYAPVSALSQVLDIAEVRPDANISSSIQSAPATNFENTTSSLSTTTHGEVSTPSPQVALHDKKENAPHPEARPPSAATKRTKADLPKFTSSSPIPFSSGNLTPEYERPRTANDMKVHSLLNGVVSGEGETPGKEKEGSKEEVERAEEPSIWDIPETPQPHLKR